MLLALLAGCAAQPRPTCPGSIPVPAPLRPHENVGRLEIRVELAREAERARGDACAAALGVR